MVQKRARVLYFDIDPGAYRPHYLGHTFHRPQSHTQSGLRQPEPRCSHIDPHHHRTGDPARRRADSALPPLASLARPLAWRLRRISARDFEAATGVIPGGCGVEWDECVYDAGVLETIP